MMSRLVGSKRSRLLRSVEERILSKKADEQKVPYLDEDCISIILVRLPIESLQNSRFVCKAWYNIAHSPAFIDTHLHSSESILIFLKSVPKEKLYPYNMISPPPEQQNTFSVEASFLQSKLVPIVEQPVIKTSSKFYIQFVEFNEGRGKIGDYKVCCLGNIRATCNGLILLDNKLKKGGLIVMNPVTKKLIALPLGTLFTSRDESYGFAFCDATGEYKVVHLFRDELGYIGCETLNLQTRLWRGVDGPSFGLFGWLGYTPVSAIGALHWVPLINGSDYIVSMKVENETFHTVPLPKICGTYDRIIEMGGQLCFVTHENLNIDIWFLESLFGSSWTMKYKISGDVIIDSIIDMVPVFSLRVGGDLIFRRHRGGSFHAYDFELQTMKDIEMEDSFPLHGSFLPHVNSLVSWTRSRYV